MSRGRLFFTVTTILLLLGTGAFWILSNENIIQNSWSLPLGTGFGILGVLVGFCQWALPFPSVEAKTPADIAASEAQESFIKQIYDRLTEGNGALIIYEKMTHIGQNVELKVKRKIISGYEKNWEEHSRANVVERTVNGRSLVAAVFPDLKPGTYQKKWGEEITVLPRQVTEIDLRGQSEKAKTPADIAAGEAQESFIKQIYDRLTEGNGALIIYEKMTHIGQNVELKVMIKREISPSFNDKWEEHSRANVVERTVNGRSLVAAVFPDLKPGTYQKKWGEEITVLPRQVTEIDLRGQSEKAEKRQSLFTSLRWASVAIGVGGSLFLASRYSTNVSVNQYLLGYGLGLMGLGVLTLIFSLLLY